MQGWKSVARILGVTALGGAGIWALTFGTFEQEMRQGGMPGGKPMPAFVLPELDEGLFEGDTTFVSSRELAGKVVLLSFWATWCKPCEAEQPSFLALQDEFGEEGLVVLGVLHRDRAGPALEWLHERNREVFRTVVGSVELGQAARVGGLPHTLLVDRHGVVSEIFAGYWPERDEYLRRRVQELLKEGA